MAIAILLFIASIFVYVYQTPRERSAVVSIVCIFTVLSLLATVLLMPVDIALVSATTTSKLGRKKDWATPDAVDNILFQLKVVYYTLYSLDAILCLLVVPFTYFWYEEYDEVATDEGTQTAASRLWGAFKYTIAFILFVVILFLIGFFVPVAKQAKQHRDLDFFKDLLTENRKSSSFSNPKLLTSVLTLYRRRACFDLRHRPPDHSRHCSLLPIHRPWSGSASIDPHQDGSSHFCSLDCSNNRLSARSEPRASTPTRRPQRRSRGWTRLQG